MVTLTKVNNLKEYYQRLSIGVDLSSMWKSLKDKSEYGGKSNELGYQLIARSMAENIARKLGLNVDLAKILTMCRGAYFPAYGKQGRKVIMQYLSQNGLGISEAELAIEYVENDLVKSGNLITPEFDSMLKELFDDSKEPKVSEVKLARICGETIDYIKLIDQIMESETPKERNDRIYQLARAEEKACVDSGKLVVSPEIKKLLDGTQGIPQKSMNKQDEKRIITKLDSFIKYAGKDKIRGVCNYIGADDIGL